MSKRKSIDGLSYDLDEFTQYFDSETVKRIKLEDGTAAEPSLCFGVDSGVYSSGTDEVAISTGGVNRVTVTSNNLTSTEPILIDHQGGGEGITLARTDGDSVGGLRVLDGAGAGWGTTTDDFRIANGSGGGSIASNASARNVMLVSGQSKFKCEANENTSFKPLQIDHQAGASQLLLARTNGDYFGVFGFLDGSALGWGTTADDIRIANFGGGATIATSASGRNVMLVGSQRNFQCEATENTSFVPINFTTGTGISFDDSGSDVLDWYETGTHVTDWDGAFTPAISGKNIEYTRVGNVVTLRLLLQVLDATPGAGKPHMTSNLPISLRPSSQLFFPVRIQDNTVDDIGILLLGSDGSINVGINASFGNVTAGVLILYEFSISYTI